MKENKKNIKNIVFFNFICLFAFLFLMNQNSTPLSNYVDYSARGRLKSIINPNLETSVSGISAARERRARHFHQLAQQSMITDPGVDSIMDSPLVRRHVGINAQVAEIHSDDSDVDETLLFE